MVKYECNDFEIVNIVQYKITHGGQMKITINLKWIIRHGPGFE